ncbi:DUF3027 domain-containing protein [Phytoactinopolyspora alkaliphila]|uniref:DUF3027 domain-containing protein n=1 Tax=Phytoactinopolyspora alkaliphila TaxID=1783498 RepID=A0A6N9YKX5_9ACTN|nr:DUF3027 domain-containing protein [Phytoactinopolyspora alkaliphila]
MSPTASRPRAAKPDAVLAGAVDVARESAVSTGGAEAVGDHQGHDVEGDRVVTHYFECLLPGYAGWRWAVTLTRASRSKQATVNECVILPGSTAVLAPRWVPWDERVSPDDLGPGDLLPVTDDDPRLDPGYTAIGDQQTMEIVDELGLGREWVLSREGRDDAAQRWYEGDSGPHTDIAKAAPAQCGTCGFAVALGGSLGQVFSVCTNERTPFDGTVVSHDHGCGGHSDVRLPTASGESPEHVVDTLSYELVPFEGDPAS